MAEGWKAAGPPGSVARIAAGRAAGAIAPAGTAIGASTATAKEPAEEAVVVSGEVTAKDVIAQVEAKGQTITQELAETVAVGLTQSGLTSETYAAGIEAVQAVKDAGGSITEQLAAGEKATGIEYGKTLVPGTMAYEEAKEAGVTVAPEPSPVELTQFERAYPGEHWAKVMGRPIFEPLGIKGVTVGDVEKVAQYIVPASLVVAGAIFAGPAVLPVSTGLLLPAAKTGLTVGLLKTGLATTAVTGGYALLTGGPPVAPDTAPYEVVEGSIKPADVTEAEGILTSTGGEVESAEADYKDAAATLGGWTKYLEEDKLHVTDEQYAKYQEDYRVYLDAEAKYKDIYGKYADVYGKYGILLGELEGAQKQVSEYLDPSTGQIDYGSMVDRLGEVGAVTLLAKAGYKPEIPLQIYENLSRDVQAYYTPSERRELAYEPGIWGRYARGVEKVFQPQVEWLREQGIVGQIGAGMYQYLVPHTLVTELYPSKGPLAALTLVPHFGPTWGYTGLTWEQQPWYGKVAGIGFGALPYAVGPLRSVAGWVGTGISRIPVVGPILGGAGRVVAYPFQVVGAGARAIKLEAWAPWRAAYEVSGLAGRAGLARVPGLGPMGAQWGWWPRGQVPVGLWQRGKITKAVEVPEFKRFEIDFAKALEGPKPLTGKALQEALYGKVPQRVGPFPYRRLGVYGEVEVGALPFQPRGFSVGIQPTIVQQVSMPSAWAQFTQFAGQIAPRVAISGFIVAPMLGAALLPMVAPTMFPQEVDLSVAAKTDIAAVDQLLREGAITQVQHDQIVDQIQTAQEVVVTGQQYQQQVQEVIQKQLTQEQIQRVREVVQEQVQQEIQVQQEVLQEMEQQEVVQWRVQEQQVVIQQLVTQFQQYEQILQQEFTPPFVPPQVPPFIPPIIPLIPFFPGAPRLGAGLARGFRAGRRRYGQMMWPFEELVLYMPEPLSMEKKAIRIRKKGKLPFGGRVPRVRMLTRKGIRV